MREIKFRGQRCDNKEWIYGFYQYTVYSKAYQRDFNLHQEDGHYIYPSHIDSSPKEIILETLGQYTGLKDKNGVGIYEGDIVRILYTDWGSKSESDPRTLKQYLNDIAHVAKVVFENNSWNVSIYGKKLNEWYLNDIMPGKHGFIEVIGNIHSNPELLK